MKHIQWYPGHMTKAMRMMEEQIALCDGVIYVLDARCPASSYNSKLKKIANGKPIVYVLNKSDLADERILEVTQKHIESCKAVCVKATAVASTARRSILSAVQKSVQEKRERNAQKGINKTFRFMVVGVPNTGKSTVINSLYGGKKAVTGDKAGVTKGKQWVRCGDIDLLDTPGTMPPSFENQVLARRLAYVGSINDDILDMDDIALALLSEIAEKYPRSLEERYAVTQPATPLEMLECVCKTRGLVMRGGEYDYERGERALIDDFRKGRLGRMTLDTQEDISRLSF